ETGSAAVNTGSASTAGAALEERNRRSPRAPAVPGGTVGGWPPEGQARGSVLSFFPAPWAGGKYGWHPAPKRPTIGAAMNDESLQRANDFLAAVAEGTSVGEVLTVSPADVGKRIGLPNALAAARAVRALRARKRLEETSEGTYRLLDSRPIEPGEPEAIPRQARRRKAKTQAGAARERSSEPGRLTYGEVGRAGIDRLVDLGREAGTLRGNLRTLREEAREAREAKDDAERRAQSLSARVKDLEGKLEMAESNLRTILTAARGNQRAETVGDAEMDAILSVLKAGGAPGADGGPFDRHAC